MANIFSLEAFNARHGDALMLHVGKPGALKHLLIDGGPAGVYKSVVRPRMAELAKADPKAQIDHLFLTHLDDDHARGVLDYLRDVEAQNAPLDCTSAWFNVLDDIEHELPAELSARRNPLDEKAKSAAVMASVAQGVDLANIAKRLNLTVNGGAGSPLIADGVGLALDVLPELKVTLIAPSRKRVDALFREWEKQVAKDAAKKGAITADYVDRSVFNLSSLVMVVELARAGGAHSPRILLTGDARGDDVLAGLEDAGFLKEGNVAFDILKIAHHGSDRDFEEEFFQQVTATNYVISADGHYDNPSTVTLEWIGKSRKPGDRYDVWLTNKTSTFEALEKNIKDAILKVPQLAQHLKFRGDDESSLIVDLLDPLTDR